MTQPPYGHAPYPPPAGQQPYAPGGYVPPGRPLPMATQPVYVVQQAAQFPRQAVTKTRRPFNHSKHIMWTIITGGMWGIGYLWLWAWNKYGPEKAVSVTKYS
jgi:hypothetical protein